MHKPLSWIEKNCRFPVFAGPDLAYKPVGPHLLPFQKRIIKQVLDKDGNIKNNLFIYGSRKVSKTFMHSMILWYLINNQKGWQAPVMSFTLPQALLIWNQLIHQDHDKKVVRFLKEKIIHTDTGSRLDFMTNSPGAALGLESGGLVADEIGTYRSDSTLLNLSTGGSLSPDKFLKLLSSNPPMSDDHFVIDLLKSCDADPEFKVHRFYLPTKEDWSCEKNWGKANPFIREYFESKGKRFHYVMRFYRSYFNRALTSKSEEHSFRRYLLGQYCGSDQEYIPAEKIKVCDDSILKQPGLRWAVGLDFSVTHDFSAAAVLGWRPGHDKIYVKPFLFLPNVQRRHDVQKHLFQQWQQADYMVIQNRDVLDGSEVADTVLGYLAERQIVPECIVFDKALAGPHTEAFKKYKTLTVKMTGREMTPAIRELERCGAAGGLHLIGENKCARWQFGNVITSQKSKHYVLMNRQSERQNIDFPVACSLALKFMIDNPKKYPVIMAV